MTPDDYQQASARTHIDAPDFTLTDQEVMVTWYALKLAGEVGELANHIGKGIYHGHGVSVERVKEELGDALWYIAGMCTIYGISLETVMRDNIAKLEKRYPSGYSSEASKARVDMKQVDPYQDGQFLSIQRASVRSPLPGDMAVCLHCNEQIRFSQMGFWIHLDPTDPKIAEHNPEPHPF